MPQKMKIWNIFVLVLFLCCVAGSILSFSIKPKLYYPSSGKDLFDYDKFEKNFKTILYLDLLANGTCGAGKNDFVVLPENIKVQITHVFADGKIVTQGIEDIAENIASQGSKVMLFDSYVGSSGIRFSGEVYCQGEQGIETKFIYGNSITEVSGELRRLAYRTSKIFFTVAASVLFLCLLVISVLTAPLNSATFGSKNEGNIGAMTRLSRFKYSVSVIFASLMLLLTYAWFVASNIYVLVEGYFKPWFFAGLVSLPFFFFAIIAILNLTRLKKYRRWINIVCITFTAITLGIILLSLIMTRLNK